MRKPPKPLSTAHPSDPGEARFRSVAETAHDGIVSADSRERITYFNKAAERIFGYAAREVLGQPLTTIMPDRLHATHLAGFRRFLETGETRVIGRTVELTGKRKDGSEFSLELSLANWTADGKPYFTAIIRDITERKQAEAERARLHEQTRADRTRLHFLSQRLLEAQETERRRIARELHDEIGQVLTAVNMDLEAARRSTDPADIAAHLEESSATVRRALQQVRDLSLDLRPPPLDDFGLLPALQWYLERQAQRTGLVADLDADALPVRAADVEIVCFRVVQEALTNVLRHARAGRVSIEIRHREGKLHLRIRDDGIGFDVHAARARAMQGASLGLLGIEERVALVGGEVTIESAPSKGTEIRATLPLSRAGPLAG